MYLEKATRIPTSVEFAILKGQVGCTTHLTTIVGMQQGTIQYPKTCNIYACPECKTAPVTAPAPLVPLPRTQTSASLLAHIGASKFADWLPLHRQARILDLRNPKIFSSIKKLL